MLMDVRMQMVSECCSVSGCLGFFYTSGFTVVLSPVARGCFLYERLQCVVGSLDARGFLYVSDFTALFCLWMLMRGRMQVVSKVCWVFGCSRIFVCKWFQSVVGSLDARGFLYTSGFTVNYLNLHYCIKCFKLYSV